MADSDALPGAFSRAAAALLPPTLGAIVCAIVCAIVSPSAWAAPGFLADVQVTRLASFSEIALHFNCTVQYRGHRPAREGDLLLVELESTGICSGVAPTAVVSREQYRPAGADDARLSSVEYDGESSGDPVLRLQFSERVQFSIAPSPDPRTMIVRVFLPAVAEPPASEPEAGSGRTASRQVRRADPPAPRYVINLQSTRRPPTTAEWPVGSPPPGKRYYVAEASIDGKTWYRLRLGSFATSEEAAGALKALQSDYPSAWIGRAAEDETATAEAGSVKPASGAVVASAAPATAAVSGDGDGTVPTPVAPAPSSAPTAAAPEEDAKIAALMSDARKAMTAGEISRAVQIYTKVLQQPGNPHQAEAQEYLALARERNGQLAHAKAEYERYLEVYPDGEGAARVRQRLAALIAGSVASDAGNRSSGTVAERRSPSPWTIRTFFTQYYRRDVNQLNDEDEIVNQSAVYSDVNLDARRRGERFDFSTRLTGGYRHDLLDEADGGNSDFRLSYAFADVADAGTGLRGRLGRQSRNDGGVRGRFDGFNLGYRVGEKLLVETVAGTPVYSTTQGADESRSFYGVSSRYGPIGSNLELGTFFLQQNIEGITDRQAVGGEFRYSGPRRNLWGMVEYDTSFAEIGSLFVQGSWRLPSKFAVSGLVDRRRSPFLSTGSALVGQPVADFAELMLLYSEEELRQLALDRSAATTTVTLGISGPLSPRFQINLNATETMLDSTVESGGVAAIPATSYRYLSSDLVASGLVKQGDVSILGVRYTDSDSTRVWSLNLDTRYPLTRALRVNPRLRVDYRRIKTDSSKEWILSPGLRMQYRWGRRVRVDFEAGKRYASRALSDTDIDRESYFVTMGYQVIY